MTKVRNSRQTINHLPAAKVRAVITILALTVGVTGAHARAAEPTGRAEPAEANEGP